jgi:hypothetical protein
MDVQNYDSYLVFYWYYANVTDLQILFTLNITQFYYVRFELFHSGDYEECSLLVCYVV